MIHLLHHLISFLAQPKHNNISPSLEGFSVVVSQVLVLDDAFGQLGDAQQGVMALADLLIGDIVDRIVAVLGKILPKVV